MSLDISLPAGTVMANIEFEILLGSSQVKYSVAFQVDDCSKLKVFENVTKFEWKHNLVSSLPSRKNYCKSKQKDAKTDIKLF